MIRKVVFMGTPDFAVPLLRALIDAPDREVAAVFTQPDKPRGRSGKLQMTPVKETAVSAGIPVYQPLKIRQPENLEILRSISPDVIVVAAFGQIIPKDILDLPPYGCINVHASLLPKYRGAAPIQWAILNGETESGVTTMRMGTGLDTGDMILKTVVPLTEDETGGSLFEKLSGAGVPLLLETLRALEDGTAVFEKQPDESPTPYASMLTRQTGRIDWNKDAAYIERFIRAMDPWPGAYTFLGGKNLKIWKASVLSAGGDTDVPAGTVEAAQKDTLTVRTGSGTLRILELQLEGKKRLGADAFLRGCHIEPGQTLE